MPAPTASVTCGHGAPHQQCFEPNQDLRNNGERAVSAHDEARVVGETQRVVRVQLNVRFST